MDKKIPPILKISFVIILLFFIGISGYYFIEEDWTLFDAFYMTAISITTVGYGEVNELTDKGRLFSVFLIFAGLGLAALFATQLARLFLENHFSQLMGEKKMTRKISLLENHYIVCGYGGMGRSICSSLDDREIPFVVVEEREESAKWAKKRGYMVLEGKAAYDTTLHQAGIQKAAGIVISMGDDSVNMYVSLAARELNPSIHIITRGYKPEIESRLIRAGANRVVYPLKLGGEQIASLIGKHLYGENQQEREGSGRVMGHSLNVYKYLEKEPLSINEMIEKLKVRKIISLRRGEEEIFEPSGELQLEENDSLLLLMNMEKKETKSDKVSDPKEIFPWNETYETGIASIDEEHRKLFEISGTFVGAVQSKVEGDYLARIFDRLIEYTVEHFENEEKLFEKASYPETEKHKKIHRDLTKRVLELNHDRNYLFPSNVEDFLSSWLKNHILIEDNKFVAFLKKSDPL